MKLTVEVTPLTHHQLTPYRLFEMLHKLAWRISRIENPRDIDGLNIGTRDALARVKFR